MTSLADIIIPLTGSISNERAQAMRKACDGLEERIEDLERYASWCKVAFGKHGADTIRGLPGRIEALELELAVLVEGTLGTDDAESVRTLARRVSDLERAVSVGAEDNGDLDVRVRALESRLPAPAARANENTGEGSPDGRTARAEGESLTSERPKANPNEAAQPLSVVGRAGIKPGPSTAPLAGEVEVLARELQRVFHAHMPNGFRLAWEEMNQEARLGYIAEARYVLERFAPRPASCSSCGDAWGIIANAHGGDWTKATDEWRRAATRWRDAWMKGERAPLPAPKPEREAQSEPPTIEEITSLVHGGEIQTHEAWARCPECRPRAEEIRSLLLAHRAPSPSPSLAAILDAGDALRSSCYQVQMTPEARAWDTARAAIKEGT